MSESEQSEPRALPALRRWEILRFKPGVYTPEAPPSLEVVTVTAHVLQFAGTDGRVLAFLDYVNDPVTGPTTRMHRIIPNYEDVQEVNSNDNRLIQ